MVCICFYYNQSINIQKSFLTMTTFTPDDFQQEAIDNINNNNCNVIVCAPTGSGKTFIAEQAMKHTLSENKLVIYTTPIKALSNEKRSCLSKTLNINVGLVTGDNKKDVESDVLVMTTEIYNKVLMTGEIKNEKLEVIRTIDSRTIGLVIFDEAHYINDKQRGQVWEESIIRSSPDTKMLLLSATIHNPQIINSWIEKVHPERNCKLIEHDIRPVPLSHSVYHITTSKFENNRKKSQSDKLYGNGLCTEVMISSGNGIEYREVDRLFERYNSFTLAKGQGLINKVTKHLTDLDRLPAIFFVFSCAKCEDYATGTQFSHNTSKDVTNASSELDKLIKDKFNAKEIMKSDKYIKLKSCIEKGVAWHHSGLLPILKEAVEILFGRGIIKVLFATETFSVGVNYPARTVVFTSITKFSNDSGRGQFELLKPFSYHQMAGRAGRRGKDTKGYVVHLPSMYGDTFYPGDLINVISPPCDSINRNFVINSKLILQGLKNFPECDTLLYIRNLCMGSFSYRELDFNLPYDEWYNKFYDYESTQTDFPCITARKRLEDTDIKSEEFLRDYREFVDGPKRVFDARNYIDSTFIKNALYLESIGCISPEKKVTAKGEAFIEFGERVNSIALIELILKDAFLNMPLPVVASLVSMFVETEIRKVNKNIVTDNKDRDRMISKFQTNRGVNTMMAEQYKLAQKFEVYDFDWEYNTNFMAIVRHWMECEDKDLFRIADKYNCHVGSLFKSLLRMKSVCSEASSAATILRKDAAAKMFMDIVVAISSHSMIQDSLYV